LASIPGPVVRLVGVRNLSPQSPVGGAQRSIDTGLWRYSLPGSSTKVFAGGVICRVVAKPFGVCLVIVVPDREPQAAA